MMRGHPIFILALAFWLAAVGARAAEGEPVSFGASFALSGRFAVLGQDMRDGATFAVERLNAQGGVMIAGQHRRLNLVVRDDQSEPLIAADHARRLIDQDHIRWLIGPFGSDATLAVGIVARARDAVVVAGSGALEPKDGDRLPHVFQLPTPADLYLRPAVDLLAQMTRARGKDPSRLHVALLFENDAFGNAVRAGAIEEMARHGMTAVVDERIIADIDDLTVSLVKMRAVKPDLVLISARDAGAFLGLRQVADLRINLPMVATTHCDSARVAEVLGARADFAFCASQWSPALDNRDEVFGSARDFAQAFQERFHHAPSYQAAAAAASVMLLAQGLSLSDKLEPASVRRALAALDRDTFFGPVRFDAKGRNIAKAPLLLQIQDQAYRLVAPSLVAEATPRWPTPTWKQRGK